MSEQAARIRSYFDGEAPQYAREREHQFSFNAQRRIALELLPRAMQRVLDVGCGPAVMADSLLGRAGEYCGIDISPRMIAEGCARLRRHPAGGRAHLVIGDADSLAFAEHFFDAVVSLGVLEYLVTYERALGEIWRVLRPGGIVVLAVPNRTSAYHRALRVTNRTRAEVKRLLGRQPRRSEVFAWNPCVPRRLDRKLARAGFSDLQGRCCNFIFHPLHELHAGASLALNRWLSARAPERLAPWLGTQYLVRAVKRA
jgi:ubiquinone/menaquinone biosynthesis C-methylase UbiE